jgi:fatty-acyl-CoA synthase
VALVGDDCSFTYAELARRVRRLANGLQRLGVERGDRVAWLGPNHPAFLEFLFASGLVGATLAPVNHRLAAADVRAVLADIEPKVMVQHGATDPVPVPGSVRHRVAVAAGVEGASDLEALVAGSPDEPVGDARGHGRHLPAAAHLGHHRAAEGSHAHPRQPDLERGELPHLRRLPQRRRHGGDRPFFRVGGTGVNVLPVLFLGGTVVVPGGLRPDRILPAMEHHRVTVGFGNPDLLEALARCEAWSQTDLSSVRFVITGGAPVPERLIRTWLDRGVTLLQGYGLSEAAPLALLLDSDSALTRVGSAGRPSLLVDIAIVGADGAAVGPGETGELLVRGPNVMAGYWNRPEATREVLSSDGWLRTGDAARSDDEGYVWIVDRVADHFLSEGRPVYSEGRPVYPGDVERALTSHPSVADAGVVQIPANGGGEVAALVVLAPGGRRPSRRSWRLDGSSWLPTRHPCP